MTSYPAIETVLGHRGDMLLVHAIEHVDATQACCTAKTDSAAWYASEAGDMPAWIGIELMAQTVGVHVGMLARMQGRPPRLGALLGTRKYTAMMACLPAGKGLRIQATQAFRDDTGVGAYDCRIELADGGETVAEATLTVFEPDDFQAFLYKERTL
ncbi:ApeP family dehydratase [Leeia aquatica]|uniref:Beta-hydroxyacyl-ACP dehydratase n=1 Tax=Leeia aquatica TaxID=2725557 RepID=A0A847S816_9NEIS|nr:beta-hydroxyacyl-ACP dehydratase [Leeia aquatica]NLR76094.1 beta-hydroxyacyl-ACP dehydratase [Leeia aquatica]